ncbi:MAG: anti-sigma regulatory factor [Candidatus Syntropharchaeia archaeon]
MKEREIQINGEYDIITARSIGKEMAREVGFGIVDQTRIVTSISELARNIVVYAGKGSIFIKEIEKNEKRGLEIIAVDEGPGIEDIELAMTDGYSTSGGLGVGLGGSKRLMDEFEIESEVGKGTTVRIRKWIQDEN